MKKNWWKKAAGLGLALALTLGLSACGGEKNENAALAKEGVYKFEEIQLPEISGDYYYVVNTAYKDGLIYMVVQVENWSSDIGSTEYHVISMKEDGTDINMVRLETPVPENGNGGGDAVMPAEPRVLPEEDGSDDTAVPEEEPDEEEESGEGESGGEDQEESDLKSAVSDVIDEPVSEPGNDFWEYSSYGNFMAGEGGSVYGIKQYQYESYGEEYYSVQKYYSCKWDSQGKLLQEIEVPVKDPDKEEEWVYVSGISIGSDGSMYLIMGGDSAYQVSVDPQGNTSPRKELPEEVRQVFSNVNTIVNHDDGSFTVMYYEENDWTKQFVVKYDPASGTLGKASPLPGTFASKGFNSIIAGIDSDLVLCDSNGVYSYNIGDEDATLKMSFVNSDLDISYFNGMILLDGNTFVGIFNDNYKDDINAGIFTYVKPEDIPDKAVLVMAGNYIPWDMKRRVVEFNRGSDEYRIVLKEYDSYNTYEDWYAGVTQLNNDITTGKMPDILIGQGLPMENYASKGLLADVGRLIEEDEELSQIEFTQNVFDAYAINDKLYYIIPSFNVQTMIGKTSIVGDRTEWTMEEAEQLLATMPEGTSLFGEMTRDSYFSAAMGYCAGDFVDVTTGKCNFNTDRFIKLMEYAKGLPESLEQDYFGEDYYLNFQTQYRENRTILMQLYISSIRDLNYNINGRFGEDVSYVGFPMEDGQGACISANNTYAISAKSNYIEGAWQFMRYYLTEEYQADLDWNLSVHMKYFKENAQLATERPFWEDPETGEKEYYDENYYINGESIVIPPMSQEQVDKVVNYILSLKKCAYYNTNVMNIINEEMGGFFTGQKSAQEVAGVIQNRVQLYVDENR